MSKRQILYIVLSFVLTALALMIVAVVVVVLQKPKVNVVWAEAAQNTAQEGRTLGKWEGKEARAIQLVQKLSVPEPPNPNKPRRRKEELATTTVQALADAKHFSKTFKLDKFSPQGWKARYLKDSYYYVSHQHQDGLINVGPTWLVDIKKGTALPKNSMALSVHEPQKPVKDFFEKERRVIGAVANHTFESGINLGGVMLIYFSQRKEVKEGDQITGWTVVHDYDDNYRAYFQWIEDGEPTYADFEFDYAKKRLRARNLLANNFMTRGRDFGSQERVGILPSNYNPEATRPRDRWTGPFRKACTTSQYRAQCKATDKLLQDKAMIAAVEWLLTIKAPSVGSFNACKKAAGDGNPPKCSWRPEALSDTTYSIQYLYDLGPSNQGSIHWEIDLKKNQITPRNKLAEMAFRTVHSRTGLGL